MGMGFRIAVSDFVKLLKAIPTEIPHKNLEEAVFIKNSEVYDHQGNRFVSGGGGSDFISKVLFDTRQVTQSSLGLSETLFLALKDKRDGHDFVENAYDLGIRQFLVSEVREGWNRLQGSVFYRVEDVLESLQSLASWYRSTLRMPVVGITGSNGKTVVKEWLYDVLKLDFGGVYRSPRSFNSQLGVAVSVLEIPNNCGLAIVEAGISSRGEMVKLHAMIKPNLVIFTHLGDAHGASFTSLEEKVAEKLQLAQDADVLIFPNDEVVVKQQVAGLKQRYPLMKTLTWGTSEGSSFRVLPHAEGEMCLRFVHRSVTHEIPLVQADIASRENSMSVLLALVAFERWDAAHVQQFAFLPKLKNRLSLVQGRRGNVVLNDSYSADIESLAVALEFLKQQSPHPITAVVLADFEQISLDQTLWMESVRELLDRYSVQRLFLVGDTLTRGVGLFSKQMATTYSSVEQLIASNDLESVSNAGILIKGAHRFGLDRVIDSLQDKHHGTYLEIDLSALAHNFRTYRSRLKGGAKVMCMVKAFGYGSGTYEAAKRLDSLGVDYLGVAYLDEGIALRTAGVKSPIMVMNVDATQWKLLKENHLEPVIYSSDILAELVEFVYRTKEGKSLCSTESPIMIHLELDTGMHRLGFGAGEASAALGAIADQRIRIASVFSHLSASEDAGSDEFTRFQIAQFSRELLSIEAKLGYSVLKHIDNSAGIVRFPEAQLSMVRLGIGLYGIDPSGVLRDNLLPVNRLVTEVSQVRTVKAGDGIGYGMHDVSAVDRKIAVIRMGYADGLWRADGKGNGEVWILGKRAPLVGNICMDMAMVDVSQVPDCAVGVEVEIFGKHITVEEVAERRGTIPYEVLTAVSQRVSRVFIEG